ncbi:MAG: pre-toxin TG domain-containing protein [Oligoflexia bacterium]|nr:pre-toxin TG domain-containing protein [Oligoflexia bacterium]
MKKTTIILLFLLAHIQTVFADSDPYSVILRPGGSETSSGATGINPIPLLNNHIDSPDFSYLERQANERLRELKAEYDNRIAEINRLISASPSTTPTIPPEVYTVAGATARAFETWIRSNAPSTANKITALGNNYTVSELSNEILSWNTYSHQKRATINLAKEYLQVAEKFEINNHLINSKITPYLMGAIQSGLDELTMAAKIAGGKTAGEFEDEIELSKSILEISKGLLDVGLGLIPIVSVGKDAYEAYTGKSFIDGHELDLGSRVSAVLGVMTGGGSNILKTSFKGVIKLGKLLHERKLLGRGFEIAVSIADYTTQIFKNPIAPIAGTFDKTAAKKFTEILNIPKGSRPLPETYLPKEYIESHLAKFDNGASRFSRKADLERYGPAQIDGTAFVLTKTDADKIIASAKGDKRALETALGHPVGYLDKNEVVRVDIPKPLDYNLRIPSGNEAGVNELWIPGGQLSDGYSEAIIDLGKASQDGWFSTPLVFK